MNTSSLLGYAVEVLKQKQHRDVWMRVGVFPSLAEALSRIQSMVTAEQVDITGVRVDRYWMQKGRTAS